VVFVHGIFGSKNESWTNKGESFPFLLAMDPSLQLNERIPSAEKRLPNGTHLTLYRDVKMKSETLKIEPVGDWLVVQERGQQREVLFFHKKDGEQKVEKVYDERSQEGEEYDPNIEAEKRSYDFCHIVESFDRENYLKWYKEII